MKKYVLIICFGLIYTNFSFSQELEKLRVGFETGCLLPLERGFGFLGTIEAKYNLQNNMNVGFKTEATGFWKHKDYSADMLSFSVTYDYYHHYSYDKHSLLQPIIFDLTLISHCCIPHIYNKQ